ncbi:MAG: hypothetical protein Fur007_02510 [Rhodoferax sp.]
MPSERMLRTDAGDLCYRLVRSPRRRSVGLRVDAHGLSVRAPLYMPLTQIDDAVHRHAAWARRKLADWAARGDDPAQRAGGIATPLGHGVQLSYLGQPLVLQLDPRAPLPHRWCHLPQGWDTAADQALVGPATLVLRLPPDAPQAKLRAQLRRVWAAQALAVLGARLMHWSAQMGVAPSGVALSRARTTWGSARRDGLIRLNQGLLHLAPALIDYVLVHELAHLREMNHSPRFWRIVEAVLPDAPLRRQQLRALGQAAVL